MFQIIFWSKLNRREKQLVITEVYMCYKLPWQSFLFTIEQQLQTSKSFENLQTNP